MNILLMQSIQINVYKCLEPSRIQAILNYISCFFVVFSVRVFVVQIDFCKIVFLLVMGLSVSKRNQFHHYNLIDFQLIADDIEMQYIVHSINEKIHSLFLFADPFFSRSFSLSSSLCVLFLNSICNLFAAHYGRCYCFLHSQRNNRFPLLRYI